MRFGTALLFAGPALASLEARQLSSIGVISQGASHTTTTTTSPTVVPSKSTVTSSTSSVTTSVTTKEGDLTGADLLYLTTTFSAASQCTEAGLSQVPNKSTALWKNVVNPVVASAYTACQPQQFYKSIVAQSSGTTMPPYRSLICPSDYDSIPFNTTYVMCCPRGFGPAGLNRINKDRPAQGALCTSRVWPSVMVTITSYDASGATNVTKTQAPKTGTLVWANIFDGTAATPFPSQSISGPPHRPSTSSSAATSSPPSSSTSTTSESTSSSAAPSPTATGFQAIGCYTEAKNGHALRGATTSSDKMSVEACQSFCSGYTYFGLEYSRECYCGNSFGLGSARTSDGSCSMPCSGNSAQTCGNGGRLSVWSKGGVDIVYPAAVASVDNYKHIGCYKEGTGGHALTGTTTAKDTMTVEACKAFCAPKYAIFGVEYGRECYCGDALSNGSVKADDGDCNMVCAGGSTELCGAGGRLNVYKSQ